MSLGQTGSGDGGDLLVFGYGCTLFRDDEKALGLERGEHLIPWMGDDTLKIGRYDGRGALANLAAFEATPAGFDPLAGLTEEERNVEEMCDQERRVSPLMIKLKDFFTV